MDILDRLRARSVRTHWQGCADHHDLCAAIEEIERLRARVADLESTEGAAWDSAIDHHEAEVSELRVEIERLRRDEARMEWIASREAEIESDGEWEWPKWIVSAGDVYGLGTGDDLREAIDKAMLDERELAERGEW